MTITYRKEVYKINSVEELLDYINSNSKFQHKIIKVKEGYEDIIADWVKSDVTVTHKHIRKTYRDLINAKSTHVIQLNFWLDRGYCVKDAKLLVSKEQSSRLEAAFAKGSFDNQLLPSHIEYWTNKGYSSKEAKSLVSESQTTFSLAKCIESLGLERGTERFHERQSKWQSNMDYTTFSTAVTWQKWLNKSDSFSTALESWVQLAISRRPSNTEVHNILDEVLNHMPATLDKLKEYCLKSPAGFNMSQSILSVLGLSLFEWKELYCRVNGILLNKNPGRAGIWGNHYYWNGNYYESDSELKIGMLFMKNGIEFKMHKRYPGQPYKYDFYIPSLDLYIEWCGMPNESYLDKRSKLGNYQIIWTNTIEDIYKIIA